jgi:phosphoribosylglycinamide formyltransferase-1
MTAGALRLGWFSTGRGEGSLGLLDAALAAIDSGALRARIEFVFCNRERGEAPGSDAFLERVNSRGIPLVTLSSKRFRDERGRRPWAELRRDYDLSALELLAGFRPAVSVTAGYMLIAPELCKRFLMVNLHPALPGGPIGTWQKVIWDLIDQHASRSGAMVGVVTEDVDSGPVLSYCSFAIRGGEYDPLWATVGDRQSPEIRAAEGEAFPLFVAIRRAGLVRERPLLVQTLVAIADRRIDPARPPESPLDLTDQIEARMGQLRQGT